VAQSVPATGWIDYDENQARIYAFADPAPFRQNRDAIAQIVQRALGVTQLDPESVDLSEPSAWLAYRAPGELMTRAHPVLPSRDEALRIAREALVKLERECSAASETWRKTVGNAPLLPPVRELSEAAPAAVPRPDGSTYDHWLYRLLPTLTLDGAGRRRALVLGAQIEVRIGHQGRVIGLNSRWHPLSGGVKYAPITLFEPPPGENDKGATGSQPLIQYVLDGDDAQQYYLAPYYARVEEHVLGLYSASPWSLTVDIGRVRQGKSTMTLVALAEGGSGDYAYHWGAFPDMGLGAFVDLDRGQAPRDNRSASQIELPNGAYIVVLNVLDRATGAFKHHRQIVASCPIESPDTGALVA
jgi:hypothetical protein